MSMKKDKFPSQSQINKYSLVLLDKTPICEFEHPTHTCKRAGRWEHDGHYYCMRHYKALTVDWDWVKKYEPYVKLLREDST